MARSGARRKPRPRQTQTRSSAPRAPARVEYSVAEQAMFFPRLRRQAKWVFVFLALAFALGFVVFGVGSGGGLGLGDILQNLGQSSGGPSVSSAKKKIDKGDPTGYKDLADAYRAENKQDQAIAALEQYVKARPKDYDVASDLAGEYSGKAGKLREQADAIQADLTATTGGGLFGLPGNSKLGRAVGTGQIDQQVTALANSKLTTIYTEYQRAQTRAAQLYGRVAAAKPDDLIDQLAYADAAYQARMNAVALRAYKRVTKLAGPDTQEGQYARQQIGLIKAQLKAGTSG